MASRPLLSAPVSKSAERSADQEIWWLASIGGADMQSVRDGKPVDYQAIHDVGGYGKRLRSGVLGRKVACYLANVAGNLSPWALARVTGLAPKTIRAHVQEVEDMRDLDRALDAVIEALVTEMRLRLARATLVRVWRGGDRPAWPAIEAAERATLKGMETETVWTGDLFAWTASS